MAYFDTTGNSTFILPQLQDVNAAPEISELLFNEKSNKFLNLLRTICASKNQGAGLLQVFHFPKKSISSFSLRAPPVFEYFSRAQNEYSSLNTCTWHPFFKKYFFIIIISSYSISGIAQVTSSGVRGVVLSQANEKLANATIIAIHEPTGERYITNATNGGSFKLPNMKTGGPYLIICSFAGFVSDTTSGIFLSLDNFTALDFTLQNKNEQITEVIVNGRKNTFFSKKRNGAVTNITKEQLAQLPTLNRSLQDFTRLSPQAIGNSFAGTNYRYNNLSIDGAALNDAFGFTESTSGAGGSQATGTPGSLARTQPISLESVQEVQVAVSPFNITAGNFTGGSINAITRSGTNTLHGSFFISGRNQIITGKSANKERTRIENFYDYQTGFRLGGAIKKSKLFYFVSAEINRRKEPVLFAPGSNGTAIPLDLAKATADTLLKRYNYNSGSYSDAELQSNSNKYFGRIDWNISSKHKLQIRNNYVSGFADYLERGANFLNYQSQGYRHISKTNSTVLELKSNFNNKLSNNLIIGYTTVNDKRNINGEIFPHLEITYNTANVIFAGAYREAAIYGLTLKTTEFTDNLVLFKNKHTLTLGTHNEIYSIDYRFLTAWNGRWAYSSPENFFANKPSRIRSVYNISDNSYAFNKNNSSAAFRVLLLSQYLQDEWQISKYFSLTAGLRFDMTVQPDVELPNNKVISIPAFSQYKNKTNSKPQIAPRVGFNWDISHNETLQLRGGAGIFNGRLPFNWLAYPYYNNGRTYGNVDYRPNGAVVPLNSDLSQIAATYQPNITEINLLDNNFKLPQIFRTSLGVDSRTKNNWTFTVEAIYSKTINDVLFKTINLKDSVAMLTNSGDNRPVYLGNSTQQKIGKEFTNVFLLTNTSEGYKYQISASVAKKLDNNYSFTAAYTYGISKDISNGVRNSPQANWEFNQTILPNNPKLAYSNSDIRHRILIVVQKQFDWEKIGNTVLSFVYNMQSGSPYSYVYIGDINRDGSPNNDLIYIPASQADANLTDIKDRNGNVIIPASQQWNNLSAYIQNDKYLNKRIGKYAERNGARTPWNNQLGMKIIHTIHLKNKNRSIQVSFDAFNLSNLISKNWGRQYFVPNLLNANYQLLTLTGISNSTKPNLNFNKPVTVPWLVDPISSRFQGQLTVRYNFKK